MNRILLIRHANTSISGHVLYGRTPGVRLSREGEAQASRLSAALKQRFELSAIISSPLERAVQTAQKIADAFETIYRTDDRLLEIDCGGWTGKPFKELHEMDEWRRFNVHRSLANPPGGESSSEVQTRAWRAIREAVSGASGVTAFVTHGDVIRGMILYLLGMPIDFIHRIEIAPASVSEISLGGDYPVVRNLNQIFY